MLIIFVNYCNYYKICNPATFGLFFFLSLKYWKDFLHSTNMSKCKWLKKKICCVRSLEDYKWAVIQNTEAVRQNHEFYKFVL